ncbi:hypothetical protein GPECTOR_18g147 [Gonium pectorale]|uniref:TOG domain-containing protein n=1 Tax=Gonium pectorale TaxID=33097 RepID=A0A150GJM0_GONPE|nr:hypothetical protein GPECTOR_18g147 [Gonium pectorale]|eukprot:KXZ49991.1 hypothetical protein GPECTOR_18g147 [Gonium pectorale]
MSSKKSVDEIWKELNAPKSKPARQGVAGLSVGLGGLPGVTSIIRTKPAATPAVHPHTNAAPQAQERPQPDLSDSPYSASDVGEDAAAYLATLQRTINCLGDPDRALRRTAATTLQTKLFTGDTSTPKASAAQLQALLCGPLLRPLVAMLSDSVERCRAVALSVLLDGGRQLSDVAPLLPELVPELSRRFGALPVQEPAEEIRLQIAQLTLLLLTMAPSTQIARFAPDLGAILCRSLEDGFPDIKKAGCSAVEAAAARLPFTALEPEAERLINSLAPNLQHQHSRVRLACIQALDALVAAGAPMALVEGSVATALRPVGHDRAQPVREAVFAALARWMGYRAPPLAGAAPAETAAAGSGQAGDAAASGAAIAARVSACGLGPPYNGSRPGPGCRAMVRSLLPQHLPPLVKQLGEWTSGLRVAAARGLHTTLVLAEDGATAHLRLLLPGLCSAVADDELEVASYVVSCVHVIGAHVSPAEWLPRMIDMLAPAGGGGGGVEAVNGGAAEAAAAGRGSGGLSTSQRTHALVVLSGLLHAAGRAGRELPPALLAALAGVLAEEGMLAAAAEHAAVRQQLLAVTSNTLAWGGAACAAVALPLHVVLLQLYGSELAGGGTGGDAPGRGAGTTHAPARALVAMAKLAACCGAAAASCDAPSLAWRPRPSDATWQHILRAALLTASPATLAALAPSLVAALHPILADREREPTLRLALLQLLDGVLEDSERGPALAAGAGQALLTDVLLPPLVWQAGKTAAAVRYAAVTALATLLGRRLPAPEHVLAAVEPPSPDDATAAAAAQARQQTGAGASSGPPGAGSGLLPLLSSALDEDWYTDMRLAACFVTEKLLELVGPQLSDASRRALYPELHKRLDDAHNAVRVAACGALRAFVAAAGPAYCDTNSGYLVAGVVIHMDDGDAAVQEAACSVLLAAAAAKPAVTAAEVRKVRERFRSKHYCDRVLAACEAAAKGG